MGTFRESSRTAASKDNVGRTTKRTAGPLPGLSPSGESAELVARWQAGDEAAADALFARYADRLARLAASRLAQRLAARIDPEDIVMSAYRSFFVGAREGRFTLARGGDLWRLLVVITVRKALDQLKRERSRRQGGDTPPADPSISPVGAGPRVADVEQVVGDEPTPEFAALVADECERLLEQLGDAGLRKVAVWKMEGYANEEIAGLLGSSLSTVARKLKAIRAIWTQEPKP